MLPLSKDKLSYLGTKCEETRKLYLVDDFVGWVSYERNPLSANLKSSYKNQAAKHEKMDLASIFGVSGGGND